MGLPDGRLFRPTQAICRAGPQFELAAAEAEWDALGIVGGIGRPMAELISRLLIASKRHMNAPTSLMETDNFKPGLPPTDAGRVSALYLMSGEFRLLAKVALSEATHLQQAKYNADIFCLGHALELTYKMLLLKDGVQNFRSHKFDKLFNWMEAGTQSRVSSIVCGAGWNSHDEFHEFLAGELDFVDRKYHEASSGWDHWTRDQTGQNIGNKLSPKLFDLCGSLHQYAASTVWKDPTLPVGATGA